MALPKNKQEFDSQLAEMTKEIELTDDFFSILHKNKLSVKGLADLINVRKYDEATKDFQLVEYYIAFEKRREALYQLEYIEEIANETYADFLSDGNDEIGEVEFIKYKEEKILTEKVELRDFVTRILSGDNVKIVKEDLKYAYGWEYQKPIRLFDIKEIAFENQSNGLLGGMKNVTYNNVISKMILGNASLKDLEELRRIPDGYGWPKLGVNQRVWAEIDLSTPDDILIESFKNFLKTSRDSKAFSEAFPDDSPYDLCSKGIVRSNHIKKWHSMRVLAYLDLKIFSSISGVRLTMKKYGDILYFDQPDIDATEKVRKTLIPLVNEIFGSGYLTNLLKKIISEG